MLACLHKLETGDAYNKHHTAMSGLKPDSGVEKAALECTRTARVHKKGCQQMSRILDLPPRPACAGDRKVGSGRGCVPQGSCLKLWNEGHEQSVQRSHRPTVTQMSKL